MSQSDPTQIFHQLSIFQNKFLVAATLDQTHRLIVRSGMKLTRATQGSLFIKKGKALVQAYGTAPKQTSGEPRPFGNVYKAFTKCKSYIITSEKFLKTHPGWKMGTVKFQVLVPLLYQKKCLGVLNLSYSDELASHEHLLDILGLFTNTASLAIRKTQLNESIKESLHNRDIFISIAGHELRTPLTTINGCIDLVHDRLQAGQMAPKRLVEIIRVEAKRMTKLVEELLVIEQIQSGKFVYKWIVLNPKEVIDKVIMEASIAFPHRQIEFVGISNIRIVGDRDKLQQVFSNVLHNANKFSRPDKPITIEMKREEGSIIISIQDHGSGIVRNEQKKIFDGFFKGSNNTKEGLGMGLYVSLRIIKRHKGTISIESERGRGTTVFIRLPLLNARI